MTTPDRTWIGVHNLIVNSLNPSAATDYITDRYILIDRDELPKVSESRGPTYEAGNSTWTYAPGLDLPSPSGLRDRAREYLALAEHLEANPPVGEAQVDALAGLLEVIDDGGSPDWNTYARRLIRQGVRMGDNQ